jgi:hypothetical protein
VQDPDWIELALPLGNVQAEGNEFYVRPAALEIPSWDFPACPPDETLLAQYNFDNGDISGLDLGEGWVSASGFLAAEMPALAQFQPVNWVDYHLRLGLILDENAAGLQIDLHATDTQFDRFRVQPGSVGLIKVVNSQEIYSDSQGVPLEPLQWYEVEVGARDGRLWVALNGEVVLQAEDPQPLSEGSIRLEALGQGAVAIDVLWVCGQQPVSPTPLPDTPVPPTPTPMPPPPPPECLLGVICGPTDWLVLVLGGLLLGGAVLGGGMLFFRGPGDPSNPGRPLPPTPGLPPIRLANAWLSQGPGGQGKPLRPDVTLAAGGAYTLHVQVQPRQQPPRQGAAQTRSYPLDVVFFFLDGDFTPPETRQVTIELPPEGSSQEVRLNLQPQRTGVRRVRVGIYHQNVLLQSLYLDMLVMEKSRRLSGAIQRSIDYVASARFMDLETLGSPRLSLFTNETANGDRWVGLFSNTDGSPAWLQQGAVHQFSTATLAARAVDARSALAKVAGERIYRLDYPLPMDADTLAQRSADLVSLAQAGYQLFTTLFVGAVRNRADKAYLRSLSQHLAQKSGTVSVARCREDSTSFPWSALYSHYLSDEQPAQLCPVFKEWLARQ